MAVPICVAMAAMSFWSPAVNGCPPRRPDRFTTPSGCGPRAVLQMMGTDNMAPSRWSLSWGQGSSTASAISGYMVRKTRAVMLHSSSTLIDGSEAGRAPSAATTRSSRDGAS